MQARKKGIARRLVPIILLIGLTGVASLYPQFLEDEEEKAPDDIAHAIKAAPSSVKKDGKCVITVSWDLNPKFMAGDYIVAKSGSVIDTVDKVRAARVIMTVKGAEKNTIEDTDCAPGSYYYVVLSKKNVIENKMGLVRDSNYTAAPAVIRAAGAEEIIVSGIKAVEIDKFKVRLTWRKLDKTGIFYYVYRSKQVINAESRLKEADKLGTAADTGEFLDEGITVPGTYYFAVTVRLLKGKEDTHLVADANFTTTGLMIQLSAPGPVALTSIDASIDKDSVLIAWNYSGEGAGRLYRLFRTTKPLKKANEVAAGDVVLKIDINKKEYKDTIPPPGKYYYGLIPFGAGGTETGDLVPGVNITRDPIVIKREKIIEQEPDDIDRILRRTFFKGKYREAIKELHNLVKNTDNNEVVTAKAQLFIGRSNIELGQYRKALDYLFLPVVKKYFPKQADFWQVFALTRLKNY